MLAVSVFLGIGLNFTPVDPIKALYWSAVVNGVLAPPVIVVDRLEFLIGEKNHWHDINGMGDYLLRALRGR